MAGQEFLDLVFIGGKFSKRALVRVEELVKDNPELEAYYPLLRKIILDGFGDYQREIKQRLVED